MEMYNNTTGYTANTRRFSDTDPPTNGTDAQLDHAVHTPTTTQRATALCTKLVTRDAMARGKMQYPNRHMDWKKPILPPNRTTLSVRTTAPRDTTANTSCVFWVGDDDVGGGGMLLMMGATHKHIAHEHSQHTKHTYRKYSRRGINVFAHGQ